MSDQNGELPHNFAGVWWLPSKEDRARDGSTRIDSILGPNAKGILTCANDWEAYDSGSATLIVIGFVSEFLAESFGFSGGFVAVIVFGFLQATIVAVLLAYLRSQA